MASDGQTLRDVLVALTSAAGFALIQNLPKLGGFLGLHWTEEQKQRNIARLDQQKLEGLERNKLITLLEASNQEKSVIISKLENRLEHYEQRLSDMRVQLAEVQIAAATNTQRMDEVKKDIAPVKQAADMLNHMSESLEK